MDRVDKKRRRHDFWYKVQGWLILLALVVLAPIGIAILIPLIVVAGALMALLHPLTWVALIVATAAVMIFGC